MRRYFGAAFLAAAMAFPAAAQQVIAKGSWVLSVPGYPALGVLGVFQSSADCQKGFANDYALAQSDYNDALQADQQGYVNPYVAAMNGAPGEQDQNMARAAAKDNYLKQNLEDQTTILNAVQGATCAQQ